MNFNKIGIAVLSAGAMFMATSCKNNVVSLKQATKWVTTHWTHKGGEELNFKQLKVTANGSGTKGDDAIDNASYWAGIFGITNFSKETLKGDATYTKDKIPLMSALIYFKYYYTADRFTTSYPNEEKVKELNAKFFLENNIFTITSSTNAKDMGEGYDEGKLKEKNKYDKEGAQLYSLFKLENAKNAISFEGQVVNISIVITFEY